MVWSSLLNRLHITTKSLATAVIEKSYTQTLSASGGKPPYTWSASNLPLGLKLSSSTITGTPTKVEKNPVTIEVKDMAHQTATVSLTLNVASLLTITTASLPGAVQGQSYAFTLSASGGTAPYTWSISSGTLPSGLTLSPAGIISGTPQQSGAFSITFEVTDNS